VTGYELVEWQIRVAAGENLSCSQEEITIHGHAQESRIYAENPDQLFLPSTCAHRHLKHPKNSNTIRVDTGIRNHDEITPFYDPMISKLIAWGEDRSKAIENLSKALNSYQIFGVKTNITFCNNLIKHKAFQSEKISTQFIPTYSHSLITTPESEKNALNYAALLVYLSQQKNQIANKQEPWSPWQSDWQNQVDETCHTVNLEYKSEMVIVAFRRKQNLFIFDSTHESVSAKLAENNFIVSRAVADQTEIYAFMAGNSVGLHFDGQHFEFKLIDPRLQSHQLSATQGTLNSPMPGTIIEVEVKKGQQVSEGDCIMIIEAMKMEHQIRSPKTGRVNVIHFKPGDQVNEGAALADIE